jgi:asparagine synthase (glutamine-hydrolysing)
MCGIAGFVCRDRNQPVNEHRLLAMRDAITPRGPDDAGCFIAAGIALSSRRLSILDLSPRGHMPMSTPDGRFHIVYNGEVYNYRELRAPLENKGVSFRSNSDTEVLLQLYAAEGPAMLERLNGMFAFAIWDARDRALFLVRDRLGVKPLYHTERDGTLYFASEEKALFAAGIRAEFDPTTWEELLCFRYVAGERTPFVGVKRLLPGHYLLWKDGQFRVQRWWSLAEKVHARRGRAPRDVPGWFRATFDDAVALRRISDVPVGVLLSGGLDSGSVAVALARQAGSGVASFTVRFAEGQYDEGPLARAVAQAHGLDDHELVVPQAGLLDRLRECAWFNDEPLAHHSDTHLAAISLYAKPRVTVLLSGEGSDETLGGYVRYRPLRRPALLHLARPVLPALAARLGLTNRLGKLARFLELGPIDRFVLYNAANVLPADLEAVGLQPEGRFEFRERILAESKGLYPGEPFRQAMFSDQHTFLCSLLDRNDRMTMGASIECRVPFMDYRLVEGLAALPSSVLLAGRNSKPLLRAALGDRLPPALLRARKWGFTAPWTIYFRQNAELRERLRALPEDRVFDEAAFDRGKLRQMVTEFLAGQNRHEALVWQLAMIAIWHETYFARLREPLARKPAELLSMQG